MGKQFQSRNSYIKLPSPPSDGPSLFAIIVCFVIAAPLGALMTFFRFRAEWKKKQYSDYKNYANIIGNRITVSIKDIANKCGKSKPTVISDLQSMIDKGYLGNGAYIDRKDKLLILDPTIVETDFAYEEIKPEVKAEPVQHKPAAPKPETIFKKADSEPIVYNFTGNEEYEQKLREIRELDLAIDNEAVSKKIDRIGHLTANIFRLVQEHPERTEEVRKFMNYYLPTTFKLLKSYSLMEKQSYQGENIMASRKKIEGILDTLVHAFEQKLDQLFHAEALDVDTDISVLETMMTSDGLIRSAPSLRTISKDKIQ